MTAPAKRGRPPLPPDRRQTERVEIRCTKAQREKLERLGGAAWIRQRIERARDVLDDFEGTELDAAIDAAMAQER